MSVPDINEVPATIAFGIQVAETIVTRQKSDEKLIIVKICAIRKELSLWLSSLLL
jgi:hypothetical protein